MHETDRQIGLFTHAAERDVADEVYDTVQGNMHASFRAPTGRYWNRVHIERGDGGHVVTDGGVVYGPWLEGVGSRNNTTRFKGYSSFRRATQRIDGRADEIAERTLPPYLARME